MLDTAVKYVNIIYNKNSTNLEKIEAKNELLNLVAPNLHFLKKLPWECMCGQKITKIEYIEEKDMFHFKCPKCLEDWFT